MSFLLQHIKLVFITSVLICLGTLSLQAQEQFEDELPTRRVDRKVRENTRKNQPDSDKVSFIYVKNGKKLLYGNRCATEATHDLGFEYVLEHRPNQPASGWWGRIKNNTLVKTRLIFTKGPWWKLVLRKKLKRCAESSGDYRG